MRVLQVMAGAEFGGAEVFFVRLVTALHNVGLDQRVVIREHPSRALALQKVGIDPLELPFGGLADFKTTRVLKREINSFEPNVVLTWMNRASNKMPKGDFVHVGRLGGYYNLKYYKNCRHLIANTEEIRKYIINDGWSEEKTHYLPNFVPGSEAKPFQRTKLYTPDNAPLIVAIGRLHKNKAFDVLLESLSRIQGVYLWIAGDGPLKKELMAKAEELGVKPRTRFLGWREDVPSLIASGDIFICPSRHEPLGNVILESWAQATPVIAAESLGPKALIKDRENGILFPVDDARALAFAIKDLLKDDQKRSRIARNGNRTFKKNFAEKKVVAQYLNFFETITSGFDSGNDEISNTDKKKS